MDFKLLPANELQFEQKQLNFKEGLRLNLIFSVERIIIIILHIYYCQVFAAVNGRPFE